MQIISILFLLATSKPLKYDSSQSCDKVPYHRIVIDQMPVIKEVNKSDYTQLLSEYLQNTGKVLKPVKRHIKCPHCGRALSRMKERSCFYIWKCTSLDCSFYKDNLNSLSKKEREIFKLKPENFKLHYIFREFTTDFVPLSSSPNYDIPSSSLSRIYSSSHTLGLILTYSINYGFSARKTASILYDVHGLKISHQTVINYRNMVSFLLIVILNLALLLLTMFYLNLKKFLMICLLLLMAILFTY